SPPACRKRGSHKYGVAVVTHRGLEDPGIIGTPGNFPRVARLREKLPPRGHGRTKLVPYERKTLGFGESRRAGIPNGRGRAGNQPERVARPEPLGLHKSEDPIHGSLNVGEHRATVDPAQR